MRVLLQSTGYTAGKPLGRNWAQGFRDAGHVADVWEGSTPRRMTEVFEEFRPDLLIGPSHYANTNLWDVSFLKAYRKAKPDFRTLIWPGGLSSWNPDVAGAIDWAVDAFYVPCPHWYTLFLEREWVQYDKPFLALPFGCRDRKEMVRPRDDLRCDVAYVGWRTLPDKKDRIEKLIVPLRGRGLNVRFHGKGWKQGWLPDEDIDPLYASAKVCVNVHQEIFNREGHHCNERTFHAPGAGGILVNDDVRYVRELFPEGNGAFVVSDDEFMDKVEWIVAKCKEDPEWETDQRRRAFEWSQKTHAWSLRAERAIRFLEGGSGWRVEDYLD